MTGEQTKKGNAAIYGAVKGWLHGKEAPYTLIGFEGRALSENSPLRQHLAATYPSASFDVKFTGDTLKLSHDEGARFMAGFQHYRQQQEAAGDLVRAHKQGQFGR